MSKPRLSVQEMKEMIEYIKMYGAHSSYTIGSNSYTLDDILDQYICNQDIAMTLVGEFLLKKG